MSVVFGIDPGQSGAISAIWLSDGKPFLKSHKLNGTEADAREFIESFDLNGAFAVIERVHSMPKQGVSSSFKFGQSYGFLRGLLIGLKVPFSEVTPQQWQKYMCCMTKGDKNISKARAQQLWPHIKFTHANADSMLIAEYGKRTNPRAKEAPHGDES